MKWGRIIFYLALSLIVICLLISFYVGWRLTHPSKNPITKTPSSYQLSYQDISFLSEDNKTHLKGWLIPSQGKPKMNIIFSHGYKGNRLDGNFLLLANRLSKEGYNIVLFDFRNSGESEGNATTVGVKEKLDLLGAIQWVKKDNKLPIALYGVSMGASTSIAVGAANGDIKGIIADSPFSDLKTYLSFSLSTWSHLPNIPFTPIILHLMPFLLHAPMSEMSPIMEVKKDTSVPIFLIHGKKDTAIPYTESEILQQANPKLISLWLTPDANHVKSYSLHKQEYEEKVLTFLHSLQ